jgi:glycogen phosphorylase
MKITPELLRSTIAYFSMEICLEESLPTYSGGLGVLAGDTLRSAADLGLPMVGVTLAHRRGYFRQRLDGAGAQSELPADWSPESRLEPAGVTVTVEIEGRTVHVRAWKYEVRGLGGHEVPVYLLDTALPENGEWDRTLTDSLYGGDDSYRLAQEVVLGMGGAALLRALGHDRGICHHCNEGHAALLALWLLEQEVAGRSGGWDAGEVRESDLEAVRAQTVFTTHTPVPAGHDRFPLDLARRVLGPARVALLERAGCIQGGELNMTVVALHCSRFVNAVALRHKEVSSAMFPGYEICAFTNGVHAATWTTPAFAELFDRRVPGWREDNNYLRYATTIALDEIRAAHAAAKGALLAEVARRTGVALDPKVFTIGFARRAATYKRADLIFSDLARLRRIVKNVGPLQIVYGGKAHPRDELGKQLIRNIHKAAAELGDALRVVYLENYEMDLGRLMTGGVDLWLNNPLRPLEASGTSGMKAALNGVPSLSVLDGWWVEGHVEGVTGWSIGPDDASDPAGDAPDMYNKLERVILPLYYGLPYAYAAVMRNCIALNGSFFNTQRMVTQYLQNAYFPSAGTEVTVAALAVG